MTTAGSLKCYECQSTRALTLRRTSFPGLWASIPTYHKAMYRSKLFRQERLRRMALHCSFRLRHLPLASRWRPPVVSRQQQPHRAVMPHHAVSSPKAVSLRRACLRASTCPEWPPVRPVDVGATVVLFSAAGEAVGSIFTAPMSVSEEVMFPNRRVLGDHRSAVHINAGWLG